MTVTLVTLDMAGTTIDEGGLVYDVLTGAVADAAGRPVPAELLARWVGTDKREAVAGLLEGIGGDVSSVDAVYADFAARLDDAYATASLSLLPGIADAADRLRSSGVKVALQTGYRLAVAEHLLDAVGWRVGRDIDALVTTDDVPASRPAPYLIFRTMEATGVHDVAEVLAAGDTPNDLAAGANAGARYVVGVLTGAADAAQLGRHRHTHVLGSVADIPDLLAAAGELPDQRS